MATEKWTGWADLFLTINACEKPVLGGMGRKHEPGVIYVLGHCCLSLEGLPTEFFLEDALKGEECYSVQVEEYTHGGRQLLLEMGSHNCCCTWAQGLQSQNL